MRPLNITSLENKPWKDVHFEKGRITPFNPNDLHQFRFRVHSVTIPPSEEDKSENAEPIVQPVLVSKQGKGAIYEKLLLDGLYRQQRYEQYVLPDDPKKYEFNQFSHALYYNINKKVWECSVFQNKKAVQIITLSDLLIGERPVAAFLLTETQKLLQNPEDSISATVFPSSINAFLMQKSHYATEFDDFTQSKNPEDGDYFFPHDQQVVCFACTGSIRSKVNSRETIETNHPLVGIFRNENKESTTLLMLEEKGKDLCGRISLYQLVYTPKTPLAAESVVIRKTRIAHEDYAQITQADLLKRYGLSEQQVCARTYKITQAQRNTLKTLIKRDRQRAETKNLQYAARAGKILIETYALFSGLFRGGLEYHNESSWCIGLLIQAGILNKQFEFHHDKNYKIPKPVSWASLFLGQTPERVLPLPKKHTTPSPSGSGGI